mgnify:CR=1 FL=1
MSVYNIIETVFSQFIPLFEQVLTDSAYNFSSIMQNSRIKLLGERIVPEYENVGWFELFRWTKEFLLEKKNIKHKLLLILVI